MRNYLLVVWYKVTGTTANSNTLSVSCTWVFSGIPLVLANDPDGDRLAAAERQPSGDWHVFSGNEIGALLGVWVWEEWRRANPDEDASNAVRNPSFFFS